MAKKQIKTQEITLEVVKQKGRPVNLNSPRQLRLKEQEERKLQGVTIQRGRPVSENSNRQQRLALKGTLQLGRPVSETSARQMKLNKINEMKANGTYKLGRPKMIKVEEVENGFIITIEKQSKDEKDQYKFECKKFISKVNPFKEEEKEDESKDEESELFSLI